MTYMTNTTDITVSAFYAVDYLGDDGYDHHTDRPTHVEISSPYFDTAAEAVEFAARFPKSTRPKVVTFNGWDEDARHGVRWVIQLAPNGSVGDKNEAGIRRYRSLCRKADAVTMKTIKAVNSYESLEAFEAAIAL